MQILRDEERAPAASAWLTGNTQMAQGSHTTVFGKHKSLSLLMQAFWPATGLFNISMQTLSLTRTHSATQASPTLWFE